MLKVERINVGYGSKIVLHEVSFELQPGELLALIGPNGSGKSTLLRAISGVLPLRTGSLQVDGKEVSQMSDQQRARKIAVVPQARNLPPAFSAREVVALGRTPYLNWLGQISSADEAKIQEAMQATDTLDLAERMVSELSGGEQQRLLLARALVQQTPLLLLDEPTTHLDLQFQYSLMQRIHRLAHPDMGNIAARAVLVALHDLNLALEYADRVALLVNGRVTRLGRPAEILLPEVLSEVYNVPLTLMKDSQTGRTAILPGK